MDVVIRELAGLDPPILDQLASIVIDCVADGASIGFVAPLLPPEAREFWRSVETPSVRLLIAEVEGTVVGTVHLQLATRANGLHRAEVAKLLVAPMMQRRGIARRLMNAIESVARREGRCLLVLDTREGDPSNLLYQSMAYVEVGRVPRYVRSSERVFEATVIYYKDLDPVLAS
ncbi:MAG: GNAT family N-acetyltransferase [Chloroflexota bacterium]|nr:MAG: GNAT family N-acetyltransferase [Chloroflexota bacterium]